VHQNPRTALSGRSQEVGFRPPDLYRMLSNLSGKRKPGPSEVIAKVTKQRDF